MTIKGQLSSFSVCPENWSLLEWGRVELLHESLPQHFPVQEYRRFSFILVRPTMAI